MIKIRKALLAYLKTIHPRVYFQEAPETAKYPYLVVDFPNVSDDGESLEVFMVDIDGWDNTPDTTEIETLMANINGNGSLENPSGLNKRTLTADNMAVTFYLENKLPLTDDDKTIRRRKYVYQARLFERS